LLRAWARSNAASASSWQGPRFFQERAAAECRIDRRVGRNQGPAESQNNFLKFTFVHFGWNENPAAALSPGDSGEFGAVEDLPLVLIVEDDPLIHAIVQESLSDGGYQIDVASSGENAVNLLEVSNGKYRALVTDINLGIDGITGWDVARRAREINPAFPVVYMSGDSAEDWASQGVPNSIMLSKPFAPAQLVTAVSQLLNEGSSIA
jgi:CheY-like chemotaxis protein